MRVNRFTCRALVRTVHIGDQNSEDDVTICEVIAPFWQVNAPKWRIDATISEDVLTICCVVLTICEDDATFWRIRLTICSGVL